MPLYAPLCPSMPLCPYAPMPLCPYVTLSLRFSPLQLRPQHVEVVLVRRLHEQHAMLRLAHADAVAFRELDSFLAVERQVDLLILAVRRDADVDVQLVGEHD